MTTKHIKSREETWKDKDPAYKQGFIDGKKHQAAMVEGLVGKLDKIAKDLRCGNNHFHREGGSGNSGLNQMTNAIIDLEELLKALKQTEKV